MTISFGVVLAFAPALSAVAAPTPAPTTPGGLAPKAVPAAPGDGVHIVKSTSGPSCSGYRSQITPPPAIRVLVHSDSNISVKLVRFQDYVDNVLPNEWIASWDAAAIKAGAIAVKSYAWYWVNHYGGYYQHDGKQECFDVTDDTNFQVYRASSSNPRTDDAVAATWNLVAQVDGSVPQTSYRASLTTNPPGPEACGAGKNGTTMSQYGSQACAQAGLAFGQILQTYYSDLQLVPNTGAISSTHVPADFAKSGATTPALFLPGGNWTIRGVTAGAYHFGADGDIPVVMDDGDGWAKIGVYRPSTSVWYSYDLYFDDWTTVRWGTRGDIPVPGHYSGLTLPTDHAVFRPSEGNWYIRGHATVHFGMRGDIPVPGRYASTTADQEAVFRPWSGVWYLRGAGQVRWGTRGDVPVPADYNGDGVTDIAVYRPTNQTFYVLESVAPGKYAHYVKVTWGTDGDIPVTGDYHGDGKADIAVYRPSNMTWYIHGQASIQFGSSGGTPVEQAPFAG